MKKFSFSLETVLSYKEQVLNSLKNEHAQILLEVRKKEKQIEDMVARYDELVVEFNENKMLGITIEHLRMYEAYLDGLFTDIKNERKRLEKLYVKEDEKKQQVIRQKQDTTSIEKLKEKKLDQYHKEEQRQEELFISEFVNNARHPHHAS